MRPFIKDGHVTLKKAFCTHCGDEFHYPSHYKQRPIFCEAHDPLTAEPIRFDGYVNAVEPLNSIAYETVQPLSNWSPLPDATAITIRLADPLVVPTGTSFSDSPKLKTAAEIRTEYQARIEAVQCPRVTPIELPMPKTGSIIGINHVGDVHIGTDACTYDAFKQMLDFVLNTEDEYIALQGDMVDLLTGSSVGVMAEQSLTIQDQFTLVTDDLLPLARARKILWMLRGNHEDRLDKATKNIVDATQTMARHLDVRYLLTEGYTNVTSAGVGYLSYNIHGFQTGQSASARRSKMEKMLSKFPSADIITSGHTHQLDVIQVDEDIVDPVTRYRSHRSRYGLFTGTFHAYQGYAADQGLGQGPLGCARIEFDIETNTILPRILPIRRIQNGYRILTPR